MMNFCGFCGERLTSPADNNAFCEKCNETSCLAASGDTMWIQCPSCGAGKNPARQSYCYSCGYCFSHKTPLTIMNRATEKTSGCIFRFCGYCGEALAQNHEYNSFCIKCGETTALAGMRETMWRKCPSCGADNNPSRQSYCYNCGYNFSHRESSRKTKTKVKKMTKTEFLFCNNYNDSEEIKHLKDIIFHLIREIDVIRETMIQESLEHGIPPKESVYGKTYRKVCIQSHNSAGPVSNHGRMKILKKWFGDMDWDIGLEETIMLAKLGYSDDEIKEYSKEAKRVSRLT